MKKTRNRKQTFIVSESDLQRLYVDERRTDEDISGIYGCTAETIRKRRLNYGIPTIKAQPGRGRDLTEELLRQEYTTEKLTMEQIADRHGVCADTVLFYLHRYDIGRETAATRRDHRPLFDDPVAKQVLLGTILGDGHLNQVGERVRLELKHGAAQREWLEFKLDRLTGIDWGPVERIDKKKNGGFDSPRDTYRAVSLTHTGLEQVYPWAYDGEGGRRISPELLAQLGPLGLATWLADDGGLSKHRYCVSANRYPWSEVERAVEWLRHRFGLSPKISHFRPRQPVIAFPACDYTFLRQMMEDQLGQVACLRYKMGLATYAECIGT